jgi:hypothetical protein
MIGGGQIDENIAIHWRERLWQDAMAPSPTRQSWL